jgi:hypothetical protein
LLQSKKHRVWEIVVAALQGQSGNTYFESMSRKSYFAPDLLANFKFKRQNLYHNLFLIGNIKSAALGMINFKFCTSQLLEFKFATSDEFNEITSPTVIRGHYKCLSQLVGVPAHLKHCAQPPTMGQTFIMTL